MKNNEKHKLTEIETFIMRYLKDHGPTSVETLAEEWRKHKLVKSSN